MSLRIRLVLLSVALVTLVAVALSALHLDTLINTVSNDALDRSERASQDVSSFLIDYLNRHASPTAKGAEEAKQDWYGIISMDPEIANRLVKTMAVWPSLAEINVANQSGRSWYLPATAAWAAIERPSRFRAMDQGQPTLPADRRDGQRHRLPGGGELGIQGQPQSVLTIQVVTSTLLLRKPLSEEVEALALISRVRCWRCCDHSDRDQSGAAPVETDRCQTIDRIVQGSYAGEHRRTARPRSSRCWKAS